MEYVNRDQYLDPEHGLLKETETSMVDYSKHVDSVSIDGDEFGPISKFTIQTTIKHFGPTKFDKVTHVEGLIELDNQDRDAFKYIGGIVDLQFKSFSKINTCKIAVSTVTVRTNKVVIEFIGAGRFIKKKNEKHGHEAGKND